MIKTDSDELIDCGVLSFAPDWFIRGLTASVVGCTWWVRLEAEGYNPRGTDSNSSSGYYAYSAFIRGAEGCGGTLISTNVFFTHDSVKPELLCQIVTCLLCHLLY